MTTNVGTAREERITGRLTLTAKDQWKLAAALQGGIENQLGDGVLPPGETTPAPVPGPGNSLEVTIEQETCAPLWCATCGDEICAGCDDTVVLDLEHNKASCGPCMGLPH